MKSKLKRPPTVEYVGGKKGKLDDVYNSAFGFGFIYGAGTVAILAILLTGAFS